MGTTTQNTLHKLFPLLIALVVTWCVSLQLHKFRSFPTYSASFPSKSAHNETSEKEKTKTPLPQPPSKSALHPPPKLLPMLNETGGLMVFLHVAKTGGTTIRKDFRHIPNLHVHRIYNEKQLQQFKPRANWFLSPENHNKSTLLMEIHGNHGQPMTAFQIHPYVEEWRRIAQANNKGFFFFTLVRDPTAYAVSYFTFFKNPGCKFSWCDPPLMNITEENLVASLVPNHQCQYLARNYDREVYNNVPITHEGCRRMYNILRENADWIGTTERMLDVTLPLLSFVLSGETKDAGTFPVQNKREGGLTVKTLGNKTLERIRQLSAYDQYIHDSVEREYTLEMWDNLASYADSLRDTRP